MALLAYHIVMVLFIVIAHILNNVSCNVLKIKNNNNNKKGIKSRSHQIIKYTHTINKSSLKNPNI